MKFSLARQYREMHRDKKQWFPGYRTLEFADDIAALVFQHSARYLLDYGSGAGMQYLAKRVHEQWGTVLPLCFDPGVSQLDQLPEGPFDGVLCIDVLEHVPEHEIGPALRYIFSVATSFAFLVICTRPAKRDLPDGRNMHVTVREPEWWEEQIEQAVPGDLHVVAKYRS